ncbi:helix-turn-helix domain-containing protein [uncultured Enterovirga sp.]|uniref:helix-turn-helix domain-containing protein n=1 Tax=uncultured Enterovirga sp. TaxID=2026352 RepID=UPI0035CC5D8A
MPPARKSKSVDASILNEMLAIRLQQLEVENGGVEAFIRKTGLARGTYHQVLRGIGNPTLKTLDRIAASLDMSVIELLGFDVDDARRALKRNGHSYESLTSALGKRREADSLLARDRKPARRPRTAKVAEKP